MKKVLTLLANGFESGSYVDENFKTFVRVFRTEITKELKKLGATDIKITSGHFYVSGFFKVGSQWFYLALSDVRDAQYVLAQGRPYEMVYRTARDTYDFTGGSNRYVQIEDGMFANMQVY
jgi:hypothetical protein